MNKRSLAVLAALIAVPAGMLTDAAVSSASPVASAAHAQLTDVNAFADGSGGGAFCRYPVYQGSTLISYDDIWEANAPPCPDTP